jgi:hypothetical protein
MVDFSVVSQQTICCRSRETRHDRKGQQNYAYVKVNHVTVEEAQQAQDIVLGMFFACSYPTIVLFDSGASHSFI